MSEQASERGLLEFVTFQDTLVGAKADGGCEQRFVDVALLCGGNGRRGDESKVSARVACRHRGHDVHSVRDCPNFWNVSALVYLLDKGTTWSTVQNLCLQRQGRGRPRP